MLTERIVRVKSLCYTTLIFFFFFIFLLFVPRFDVNLLWDCSIPAPANYCQTLVISRGLLAVIVTPWISALFLLIIIYLSSSKWGYTPTVPIPELVPFKMTVTSPGFKRVRMLGSRHGTDRAASWPCLMTNASWQKFSVNVSCMLWPGGPSPLILSRDWGSPHYQQIVSP